MPLVFGAITPHPPIIVPGVGSKRDFAKCEATVNAMENLAARFAATKPDVVVIVSPHSPLTQDAFAINLATPLTSSLVDFGVSSPAYTLETNQELAQQIIVGVESSHKFRMAPIQTPDLDHGANVPLHFLMAAYPDVSLVSLSYTTRPLEDHLEFGELLAKAFAKTPKRVALIASGDLSHRLTEEAPAGYSPKAKDFDKTLVNILEKNDAKGVLALDEDVIEDAGECGLRSFTVLLGALSNKKVVPEVISYGGPFGVGYLVLDYKLE